MTQATQHHRLGELEAAKALYLKILKSQPGNPDALHLFGLACHQQGDHWTAVKYIRQAVEKVPGQPVLRNNLGDALHKAGDLGEAVGQLQQALALRPGYAGAHLNLGVVLAALGDHDAGLLHSQEAARLDPERAEAWFNLGMLQLDHVALEDSIQSLRVALRIRPTYRAAACSLLYALNLLPGADPVAVADEHCRVASGLFSSVQRVSTWPMPAGKIRIGYVSGDFRAHAVNYFLEPVLEHQDRDRFEIFCYSDVTRPDNVTERLRGFVRHWREISDLNDEGVTELIRSDQIDILVDLAGYTEHCRLGVFAAKPARCQISTIGYPNTTGLGAMDFRVVDSITAPLDQAPVGIESLLRLPPGFACFRPPQHAPQVRRAPVSLNGFVTFGCLHKLEKLNAVVVETWAQILRENPESRLLVARDQLDAWHQHRLEVAFAKLGIGADRLELVHLCDPAQSFFEVFSRIDILLDVFPWSGHTIACCALWMGVPVLTLRGESHAGRMVASVLDGLGLNELIGEDVDSYSRIAGDFCRQPDRIAELRAGMRARMQQSPLRDESGFTRAFEAGCLSAFNDTLASDTSG
ncbi:tetratricopeptide repeat protein [Dokdonella sp.]|uniref:O-linked N-acetylglucosamine transferase, SPINDLY family protein n=1 Tax=Dokdonella sp. TaxID=2291710 RepID=UPI003C5ADF27